MEDGGGASSCMSTSMCANGALEGDLVWRGRRAGDWSPLDKDLVDVGDAGDHPSDGVAGTHI